MDEIKNVCNNIINLMEQDNRGVQLGCYSVALIGLTAAIRRVRPFSRFRRPSDIPNHFINERRELAGLVERIDPNGGLLMVKHKPLVNVPGIPVGQLPVKISGVKVAGLGLNWLQAIVVGNEVKFIPVAKAQDFVLCQVLLSQTTQSKTQTLNIGECLVKIGFADVVDVDGPISKDPAYLTYFCQLKAAHNYATRKRLGLKYYIEPTKSALTAIIKSLNRTLLVSYRHIVHVPKMNVS